MPEQRVSVDDVAKHLGVAKDSIYRWIERKGFPAHKSGPGDNHRHGEVPKGDQESGLRARGSTDHLH